MKEPVGPLELEPGKQYFVWFEDQETEIEFTATFVGWFHDNDDIHPEPPTEGKPVVTVWDVGGLTIASKLLTAWEYEEENNARG